MAYLFLNEVVDLNVTPKSEQNKQLKL